MQADLKKASKWLIDSTVALPGLDSILSQAKSEVLIIGAGVFSIYQEQEWIPQFKRKTGDLDLSVGLVSGESDYALLSRAFLDNSYETRKGEPPYRYYSPKRLPGVPTYVDLLAHPAAESISEAQARSVMGVGSGFSLAAMQFARQEAFQIGAGILYPNPIALMALKRESYLDNPGERLKDLADILELVSGLVEKGTHFHIAPLWEILKKFADAHKVRAMLSGLAGGNSAQWDMESARQELLDRDFTEDDVDNMIPARILEFIAELDTTE